LGWREKFNALCFGEPDKEREKKALKKEGTCKTIKRSNETYLAPFAPIPLRTSKLITVCNIHRPQRLITILIIDKLMIYGLQVHTPNISDLSAAFLTASDGAVAPTTSFPFISRCGRSGFDIVNVVIKDRRRVVGIA